MGDEIQMMIAEGGFLIGRGEARGGFLFLFTLQPPAFAKAMSWLARRAAKPWLIDRTLMQGPPPLARLFRTGSQVVF